MLAALFVVGIWAAPEASGTCPAEPRRLTHEAENYAPRWSPDGAWIAFESTRDHALDLYLMRPDGSEVRQLTDASHRDVGPNWHPDGQRLAFFSERDDPGGAGGGWRAFTVDLEDGRVRRLVKGDRVAVFRPVFSPDGEFVAFDGWSEKHPWHALYLYEVGRRRSLERLTEARRYTSAPRWSPDGATLAFFQMAEDRLSSEIYVMDRETRQIRQVTRLRRSSQYPAWSPDGGKLVFESHHEDNWEILSVDLETGAIINHTNHPTKDTSPELHPMRPWLLFISERDGLPQVFCRDFNAGTPMQIPAPDPAG